MSTPTHPAVPATIWTIGHSTRPIDQFLGLLAEYAIGYHWLATLGGRRRVLPDSPNTAWRNASFRGYADYMASAEFAQGLVQLLELASKARTALMCAEAVWWRCHRSMIADALCVRGIEVMHILDAKHSVVHPMTSPARIVRGWLTYAADGEPAESAKRP
jgi:uncharacterized protein (DUF488 family)